MAEDVSKSRYMRLAKPKNGDINVQQCRNKKKREENAKM